jgi:hypothetical protein
LDYLSTADVGKLCGCTRVWAFKKARDGFFDEFKLAGWHGKHYRFKDNPKLRARCKAIKSDRERARLPKPKSDAGGGVTTWGGIRVQFDIIRRRIGDWQEWDAEKIAYVRGEIAQIVAFDRQLASVKH